MQSTPFLAIALVVALATPAPAAAQQPHPGCDGMDPGGNACQVAVDIFQYMNPQLGMLITGGNATLGQGGPLGGVGRFVFTVRANGSRQMSVPRIDGVDLSGPVEQNEYSTAMHTGVFPVADVAVGLWGGMPMGVTRVGGLDALVNVFYLPSHALGVLDGDGYSVALPDARVKLGFGARLGIIGETLLLPGVALTYIQRELPTISFTGFTTDVSPRDTVQVDQLDVRTRAWRLTAGKSLGPVALAVGYGQDRYSTSATLGWVAHGGFFRTEGQLPVAQRVTRDNMFADLSLNLFVFRVVAELGRVSGGDLITYNEFDESAGRARTYGAIGLRVGR